MGGYVMKLDFDCVRDILLYVEENSGYQDSNSDMPSKHKEIPHARIISDSFFSKYNKEDAVHTLELMIKEGLFDFASKPIYDSNNNLVYARIIGLTWYGHELLTNIRNDTVWNAVKEKSKKVGKVSIKAMASAAATLATAMLTDPNAVQNFMNGAQNLVGSIH